MNEKEVFAYLTNLFEREYNTPKASSIKLARDLISAYGTQELDKRIKANNLINFIASSREVQLYNKTLTNAGVATEDKSESAKQASKVTLQAQRLKEANAAMPKIDNVAQRFEYIDKAFYDKMPDETKARFSSAQVIKVDYVDMNGKKGIEEKVRVAVPINERVQVDELNVMDKDSTIVPYPQSYKDDYEVKRAKAEEDLKIRDQKKMEDSDEFIGPKEPEEYADGGNITVDMVKQAEKQKDSLFKSLAGLAAKAMKYKDGGGLKLNEVSKFNYSKYKS